MAMNSKQKRRMRENALKRDLANPTSAGCQQFENKPFAILSKMTVKSEGARSAESARPKTDEPKPAMPSPTPSISLTQNTKKFAPSQTVQQAIQKKPNPSQPQKSHAAHPTPDLPATTPQQTHKKPRLSKHANMSLTERLIKDLISEDMLKQLSKQALELEKRSKAAPKSSHRSVPAKRPLMPAQKNIRSQATSAKPVEPRTAAPAPPTPETPKQKPDPRWWDPAGLKSADELLVKLPKAQSDFSSATQIPQTSGITRNTSRQHNICVGLDFGTSSIKMCWCERSSDAQVSNPILHPEAPNDMESYCLPSVACIDGNKLLLGWDAIARKKSVPHLKFLQSFKFLAACEGDSENAGGTAHFHDDLLWHEYTKLLVFTHKINPDTLSPSKVSAILLAYAMRLAESAVAKAVQSDNLNLTFVVGIPIEIMQARGVLPHFQKILAEAEVIYTHMKAMLSVRDIAIMVDGCNYGPAGMDGVDMCLRKDPNARVIGVPEAVAQVLSYIRSLGVEEGLHAVVDIGAGTTDICVFRLNKKYADIPELPSIQSGKRKGTIFQSWLAASYIPIGAFHIERAASAADKLTGSKLSNASVRPDLDRRFDRHLRDNFQHAKKSGSLEMFWNAWNSGQLIGNFASNAAEKAVLNSHFNIWQRADNAYMNAYKKHRNTRDFEALNLYLCGGGSLIGGTSAQCVPWCKEIRVLWQKNLLQSPNINPKYRERNAPFIRMAVAYGLSLDPIYYWGAFQLPNNVPDREIQLDDRPCWMNIHDGDNVGAAGG